MIVYGPNWFLGDGPVYKSTVWSKFRRFVVSSFRRFVVSLFRRFTIETEEPSKFQSRGGTEPGCVPTRFSDFGFEGLI